VSGAARALALTEARRLRLSLELLLERRLITAAVVDVLVLLNALVQALVSNMSAGTTYAAVVIVPCIVLGIPILSNAVALERRAGSLDLLLASQTAHAVFVRRFLSFGALLAAQGWALLIVARLLPGPSFALLPLLAQSLSLCLLVCAIVFFWALRLRDSGPVMFASLVTFLLLGRWTLAIPVADSNTLPAEFLLDWLETNAVLLGAALVFYLYARRRLTRPERLVT
jgi:hypothetical protein